MSKDIGIILTGYDSELEHYAITENSQLVGVIGYNPALNMLEYGYYKDIDLTENDTAQQLRHIQKALFRGVFNDPECKNNTTIRQLEEASEKKLTREMYDATKKLLEELDTTIIKYIKSSQAKNDLLTLISSINDILSTHFDESMISNERYTEFFKKLESEYSQNTLTKDSSE